MKIAVMGSAPSSLALAPYKDAQAAAITSAPDVHPLNPFEGQEWEIWGCSPGLYGPQQRMNVWFELHRWEPGAQWFSPEYCAWVRAFRGPVYVGGNIPEIANAVRYPIDRVEAVFSSFNLTSSIALMLALAILKIEDTWAAGTPKDQGTIGLWGVDMSANEEWNEQRPGCQNLVLEALRRGIEIYVPPESDLLRPMPVYGLSEWDHQYIKGVARMKELQAKRSNVQRQLQEATVNERFLAGAIDDHNWQIKTWASRYGLPHGVYLRNNGDGLGGGTSVTDAPPIASPAPPVVTGGTTTPSATPAVARSYVGRTKPKATKRAKKRRR